MRTRPITAALVLLLTLGFADRASAQYGYGGYGGGYGAYGYGGYGAYAGRFGVGAMGGFGYRGIGGSLSPYLNLINRGIGNPATNYYNFVRPGVMNPGVSAPLAGGPTYLTRPPLFPQTPSEDDERRRTEFNERADQAKQSGLPPTGHATFYNETFGYFGAQSGMPGSGLGGRGAAARLGRPR